MPSRNKNFIILPKSWSGHGRTDRTGSAGPARVACQFGVDIFKMLLKTPISQVYTGTAQNKSTFKSSFEERCDLV